MNLTTDNLIRWLPIGKDLKDRLQNDFDSLSDEQRFAIAQLLWDAYFAFYEIKYEENIALAYEKAKNGDIPFDKEFYKRIGEETKEQMQQEFSEEAEEDALSETREKLNEILNNTSQA